jgi:drug/metabolite transporter (DMT)-like permease
MKLFWAIIKISGVAIIFVAIVGFVLGQFDYVLEISGSALPLVDGPLALILSPIGLVFFFAGYVLQRRAEKKDEGKSAPQLDINDLSFVERAIARTRRRNLIIGFFLAAFGVFMLVIPFLDPEADPSSGGSIFLYCFAALIIFLGVFMMFKAVQLFNIADTEIYRKIMLEPKTITGLDAQIVRSAYTKHSSTINAHLFISTKKIAVLTVNETELELLRQYLLRHNPGLQYNVTEQRVS